MAIVVIVEDELCFLKVDDHEVIGLAQNKSNKEQLR